MSCGVADPAAGYVISRDSLDVGGLMFFRTGLKDGRERSFGKIKSCQQDDDCNDKHRG